MLNKKNIFRIKFFINFFCMIKKICTLHPFFEEKTCFFLRRDARVVEEARLESVYTPKVYRGFESRFLRKEQR